MGDPEAAATTAESVAAALEARLSRPQRHRLLQGYPAMPQMQLAAPRDGERSDFVRTIAGALVPSQASILRARVLSPGAPVPGPAEPPFVTVDSTRELIVGIIPHTQCTPKVEGCGFCTFPHDRSDKAARGASADVVLSEIERMGEHEALRGRSVSALYFGGGTANLAKPEVIEGLFARLAMHAQLRDAEVSLEGVASLFTSWFHAPLKMLERLPVRRRRISMGIQTFDRRVIDEMGRGAFGDEAAVNKLVARARSMDIGTSGDFLFNLPGQSQRAMVDDVERAIASGLDQVCLYNLVLYEGLGTPWSKDPARVAAMPDNETACGNWIVLRERLLAEGFVQTTLTNFERRDVAASDRAFRYERASFSPERTDGLGFGPMSLSVLVDPVARRAVKLQRSKDLRTSPFSGDDLYFRMEGDDFRLLFVTRSLAKGAFERETYARCCGTDVAVDFAESLAALARRDLVELTPTHVALTPRGMFFSDAVVATLVAEKGRPRSGAGVRTSQALAAPLRVFYEGMG